MEELEPEENKKENENQEENKKEEENIKENENEKEEEKKEEKKEEQEEPEKYKITNEEIGKGKFGVYYKATDLNDDTILYVAKQIDETKENKEVLENEININKKYQHENLVKVLGTQNINGKFYFIYEYCNGGSLASNYDKYFKKFGNPFSERIVQKILKDILKGLYYLHDQKIVHHDIKPENILVQFNNETDIKNLNLYSATYKIAPSCLSRIVEESEIEEEPINVFPPRKIIKKNDIENRAAELLGNTLTYMPPCIIDQLINEQNSMKFAVDIWSYGILGFKLLFGRHPFLSRIEEENLSKEKKSKEEKLSEKLSKEKKPPKEEKKFLNSKKLEILYKNFKNGIYIIDLSKEYVNEVSKEALIFFDEVLKRNQNFRNSCQSILKLKFIRANPSKFNKISEKDLDKDPENEPEENLINLPSQLRRNEKRTVLTLDINDNVKLSTLEGFNNL
jgi:serine/threonine protein kinase